MYLQAKLKTMYIKISWILKSQLILLYTVSKKRYIKYLAWKRVH